MFMPLARLVQYQHCAMRRADMRVFWSNDSDVTQSLADQFASIRDTWMAAVDAEPDEYE